MVLFQEHNRHSWAKNQERIKAQSKKKRKKMGKQMTEWMSVKIVPQLWTPEYIHMCLVSSYKTSAMRSRISSKLRMIHTGRCRTKKKEKRRNQYVNRYVVSGLRNFPPGSLSTNSTDSARAGQIIHRDHRDPVFAVMMCCARRAVSDKRRTWQEACDTHSTRRLW